MIDLFEISMWFKNFPIQRAREKLAAIQKRTLEDVNGYLTIKKKEIFEYHFKTNSFYKNFIGRTVKADDWNSIPVVSKRDLQIPLDKRLSSGFNLKNVYTNKTSGSTGDPFYFAKDKFSHALTWALIENRFGWHNLKGTKQARFYGIPKEQIPKFKERLKDLVLNRVRFDVFDLSDSAFEKWVIKFSNHKIVYLNGYTTVILAFANYLIRNKLVLNNICNSLKACVVTSEMCFEEDRELMKKAFGIPVINEYGASELDLIAFQNKDEDWILNTETLFVEVLDKYNKPLPLGQVGKIVITSLYNRAHPFIRYEIGDVGSIALNDKNKLILKKLEGRREDLIYLQNGKKLPGLTFYYITKSVMTMSNNVKEIKVFQTEIDIFEIHYIAKNSLNNSQKKIIEEAVKDYLECNVEIIFSRKNELIRSKSGKLKQFTSYIKT